MKIINWINKYEIFNAYILDGVDTLLAKILTFFDCNNNPYEKELKELEERDLRDAALLNGKSVSILSNLKHFTGTEIIENVLRFLAIFLIGTFLLAFFLVLLYFLSGMIHSSLGMFFEFLSSLF